jgi:hypothetical protein
MRCATCVGPLRSPDEAIPSANGAVAPPGGLAGGSVSAIAADDPISGPVSLGSQAVWFRIPVRVAPAP